MIPESSSSKKGPQLAVILNVLDAVLIKRLSTIIYPFVALFQLMKGTVILLGVSTTITEKGTERP